MGSPGGSMTSAALLITVLAVGAAVASTGGTHSTLNGYAPLVSLLGVLAGVNLVALGVWMTDNPATAFSTHVHRSLAIVGVAIASSAVTAVAAGPALCFGLFVVLLLGVSLIISGVLGTA